MKIELDQADITSALTKYIGDLGLNTEGKVVTLNLIAGRGDNGNRVEVFITLPEDTAVVESNSKPKTTRTRKPKADKVAEVPENVQPETKEPETEVPDNNTDVEFDSDADIADVEFDPDAATTAALNKAAAEIAGDDDASLFD